MPSLPHPIFHKDSEFEADAAPVEKIDYCATEEDTEAVETAAEESAVEQPDAQVKRVYFVRVPRPPMDDSSAGLLKRLQDDFQAHVAKIKKLNGKLATKRVGCFEEDDGGKDMENGHQIYNLTDHRLLSA